ncbi:inositol monophosphatase family protein [Novosphingobium sp. 1949]|uniref:Inositol monophosphatase family protein n=1 Tax=Novosphingobium organovorum TaxID=2930092 RepID=A0ABT0BBU5_9SPHN|nr:inositol monophosphatase family protein [Novosphingobium organovorum]MCJ2182524.1 inositol monophosphatase family protein [Novosphingobium organovorum]
MKDPHATPFATLTACAAPADLAPMIAVANAACDAARALVRTYFRTGVAAETKGDESPVTAADRAVEQGMIAIITKAFPDHGILGEEFGLRNAESPWRWILDPIDGTRAFITGRPQFGTLVSLTYAGTPVLGVIDQPLLEERWVGQCGAATAFSGGLGGTVGTRKCPSLALAELSCTSPDMIAPDDGTGWGQLARSVRRVSWGGDCYAYGLLALGHIDIIAEGDLKIWDWAALQPVVEGAGGSLTDWQGRPLDANSDGRVLALGDPSLLPDAVAMLNP